MQSNFQRSNVENIFKFVNCPSLCRYNFETPCAIFPTQKNLQPVRFRSLSRIYTEEELKQIYLLQQQRAPETQILHQKMVTSQIYITNYLTWGKLFM